MPVLAASSHVWLIITDRKTNACSHRGGNNSPHQEEDLLGISGDRLLPLGGVGVFRQEVLQGALARPRIDRVEDLGAADGWRLVANC